MSWYDEHGDPTDRLVEDWAIHDDHADGYDPADGERDEMGEAVAAVYDRLAPELAACTAAATRVRDTAHSGDDYAQARAGFELAVRFDALHAKLREVTHQPAGEDG